MPLYTTDKILHQGFIIILHIHGCTCTRVNGKSVCMCVVCVHVCVCLSLLQNIRHVCMRERQNEHTLFSKM